MFEISEVADDLVKITSISTARELLEYYMKFARTHEKYLTDAPVVTFRDERSS